MTDYGGDEKDWRLQATLGASQQPRSSNPLLERLRGGVAGELRGAVPHDVVVTHDADQLFAYAASESLLAEARDAIERTLREDEVTASIRISHWDDDLDDWRQTDPPPSSDEQRETADTMRDAATVETRTVVASAGKLVRAEFEQSLRDWATRLGVECSVVEHPQLLVTQVAFTVKGPRRKVEEFVQGVSAEELTSIRIERNTIVSQI